MASSFGRFSSSGLSPGFLEGAEVPKLFVSSPLTVMHPPRLADATASTVSDFLDLDTDATHSSELLPHGFEASAMSQQRIRESFEIVASDMRQAYAQKLKSVEGKYEALKRDFQTNYQIIESRNAEICEMEKQLEDLTAVLERKVTEERSLKLEHRRRLNLCRQMCEKSMNELKEEFDRQLQASNQRLGAERKEWQSREHSHKSLTCQLTAEKQTGADLRLEVDKLQTQLSAEQCLRSEAQRKYEYQISGILSSAEQVQTEMEKRHSSNRQLVQRIEDRVNAMESDTLSRLRNGLIRGLHQCKMAAKRKSQESDERIDALESELSSAKRKESALLKEFASKDEEYSAQIVELGQRMDAEMTAKMRSLEECVSVKAKLRDTLAQSHARKSEIVRFEDERRSLTDALMRKTQECSLLQSDLQKLTKTVSKLKDASEQLKSVNKKCREMREKMEEMCVEMKQKTASIAQSEEELERNDAHCQWQTELLTKLRKDLSESRVAVTRLTADNQNLSQMNQDLQHSSYKLQLRFDEERAKRQLRKRAEAEEMKRLAKEKVRREERDSDYCSVQRTGSGKRKKQKTKTRSGVSVMETMSRRRKYSSSDCDEYETSSSVTEERTASQSSNDECELAHLRATKRGKLEGSSALKTGSRTRKSVSRRRSRHSRSSDAPVKKVGRLKQKNRALWQDLNRSLVHGSAEEISMLCDSYTGITTLKQRKSVAKPRKRSSQKTKDG